MARAPERDLARWLVATGGWSCVVLGVAIAGLANLQPRLPVDHYHAFLDPLVFLVVGLGFAGLVKLGPLRGGSRRYSSVAGRPLTVGWVVAAVLLAGLTAWNIVRMPPGWLPVTAATRPPRWSADGS